MADLFKKESFMKRCRLVLTGSGGQGVITAAIILAETAVLHDNLNAVQSQAYGPEARGGATRSDVIISKETINFPKVYQPNVLVCLTQQAYTKFYQIVRPGGLLLTDSRFVEIERKASANQKQLPMYDSVMEQIGKPIVFNICMLGALVALTDLVREESVRQVLKGRIPSGFIDINYQAFDIGLSLGRAAKA